MAKEKFDVVIVPDFLGTAQESFKIRTLFFLASWLEYGGFTKTYPLHIACIGHPPKSVYSLGKRCHASFTIHEPVHEIRFLNKLRGLEIEGVAKNALLLDVDVLMLKDISDLATTLPANCISADVANDAHLSKSQWTHLYATLNLPCPPAQMTTLNRAIKVNMNNNPNYDESIATFPYYNSGILFFPWRCDLRMLWEQHNLAIIPKMLQEKANSPSKSVLISDQPALATAITHLKLQGIQFRPLPKVYHVRWQHIYAHQLSIRETRLFHAVGIFKQLSPNLMQAIEAYQHLLTHQCTTALNRRKPHVNALTGIYLTIKYKLALQDIARLRAILETLYIKYVQPALETEAI